MAIFVAAFFFDSGRSSVMLFGNFSVSFLLFVGSRGQISLNLVFFAFRWFLLFAFFDYVYVFDRFRSPFEHVLASKLNQRS